ncbi:hypothetical protein EDD18DRAFT_1457450 [Armillaria luteobubalina]|uniref:F-box domain-containing protein n=1 Tax=Armillaria luteobubalina TaxID=153913 RepID=A0AA39UZB9_9AGAR|nr:hypothetical protein EDD18DRAFT_257208 [Armillaria luteobubalina]KAK0504419.1 hypothetical protein EDD18DRAFT_1457450 [Armillaria luteobubalina]
MPLGFSYFQRRRVFLDLPLEVYALILSYLTPLDVISFGRVDRKRRTIVESYFWSEFIQLMVSYFSEKELLEFRLIQAKTGTLISGSTVVQFLERTIYPGSDLDIYTPFRYGREVGEFLLKIGYEFRPRASQTKPFHEITEDVIHEVADDEIYVCRGIVQVFDFHRNGKKIQVMSARNSPMDIILSYHCTTVMNIITATHAYSLYPRTTFHQRRGLIISTNGSSQDAGRQKYIDRGWDLFSELTVFEVTNPYSEFQAHSLRWVGDRRCLSVKLPPMELPFSPYPIRVNSWQMAYGWNCTVKIERESIDTDRFDFCVSQGARLCRALNKLEGLWTIASDKCKMVDDVFAAIVERYYKRCASVSSTDAALEWLEEPNVSFEMLEDIF